MERTEGKVRELQAQAAILHGAVAARVAACSVCYAVVYPWVRVPNEGARHAHQTETRHISRMRQHASTAACAPGGAIPIRYTDEDVQLTQFKEQTNAGQCDVKCQHSCHRHMYMGMAGIQKEQQAAAKAGSKVKAQSCPCSS